MFVRTQSHSLGRHWAHHLGRAALRYALVLALLALTLFTGPQPAHAVATASSTPGTVVAWGSNLLDASTVPSDLTDVIAIAAGGYQNLAIKSDGTVVAWGNNNRGQGNIPSGLANVTAIAAGNGHNLALKADGTVVAWGNNNRGQGNVPAGLDNVIAIAAGTVHSLALKGDGTVVAWGHNDYGQATVPNDLTGVTAIAAGENHSLALKSDGTVVAWGANFAGQATVPAGLSDVTAIAAGINHSLALKADGTVVAWGDNFSGQATVPAGLTGVTAIAAGGYHSLALKADGTVVAWGHNDYGQISVPGNLANVTAITAGTYHSVALVPSVAAPEIDVLGNSNSIVSGDSTPATADHTAFGSAEINSGTVVRTFTILNSGDAELSAITVSVERYQPAAAQSGAVLPFSLTSVPATTVAAGQSTQFQITFAPSESGESSAVVIIESNDANEGYYVFVISGSGSARLLPNTQVATASAATQRCAAGSPGYMRDCTVTFNLRNVGSDAMLVGHYRVNSVSAHAYVLNGEPTPGQAGTTVQAGELVNANGIFQPQFVIGLTSLTRYSINISVFGYAGVTAAGTDATDATILIDQTQLAEIATFEVVLEPAEAAANFQFFLPIVQQ